MRKNGLLLMSDGNEIYFAKPGNNWQKINISGNMPLKNITRMALNKENTKLAVVMNND